MNKQDVYPEVLNDELADVFERIRKDPSLATEILVMRCILAVAIKHDNFSLAFKAVTAIVRLARAEAYTCRLQPELELQLINIGKASLRTMRRRK